MKRNYSIVTIITLILSSFLCASEGGDFPLVPIYKKPTQSMTKTEKTVAIMNAKQKVRANLQSLSELVEAADKAIKAKECQIDRITWVLSHHLSEAVIVDICAVAFEGLNNDEKRADDVYKALYKKNCYFQGAVDLLRKSALQNIGSATCNNIANIENQTLPQPVIILNKIPFLLKKIVMDDVKQNIDANYDITLTGHTDQVQNLDIHTPTGQAVTSGKDRTIRLWDLTNGGTCVAVFQDDCLASNLCFNLAGSYIATTYNWEVCCTEASIITQRKITPSGFQLTHSCQLDPLLGPIQYFSPNGLVVMSRGMKNDNVYCQTIILFNENGETEKLGSTTNKISVEDLFSHRGRYKVSTKNSMMDVIITKQHCYDLYLCEQAIQNTQQQQALGNVIESQSYSQLTPYEQSMIKQQIRKKIAVLTAIEKKEKK